jgi:hypothetical protein
MARNVITAEHVEKACVMMAAGKSLRAAAKDMGLDEAAIRYHLMKDADAFSHSARARELGCDALADECLEIADGNDPTDVKRVKIDTRIRLIGKWSQRYDDKLTIRSKSEVVHRYDLDKFGRHWRSAPFSGSLNTPTRSTSGLSTTSKSQPSWKPLSVVRLTG